LESPRAASYNEAMPKEPIMTAEFEGVLKDGRIEVPADVAQQFSGPVHVVLSEPARKPAQSSMIQTLLDHPLVIKDFQPLSREDANAR
jgi:hypothetical protein